MTCPRALAVLLLAAAPGLAEEVQTLTGKQHKGTVVEITKEALRVRDEAGQEQQVPLAEVLAVNFGGQPAKGARFTLLRLFDDSLLHCSAITFGGDKVTATLLTGPKVVVPLDSVVALLREAQDDKVRQQWEQLQKKGAKQDRILVVRDGQVNALDGVLGDVDAAGEHIQFRREADVLQVKLSRADGLIFQRVNAPTQSPVCLVHDTAGNVLAATDVTLKDGQYVIATTTGASVPFAAKQLVKLDYNRGKLNYLSDLRPVAVEKGSKVGVIRLYRADENLNGEPIYLGSVKYPKGLSLHAHTELEYDLGGNYKNFQAVLGADPRVGEVKSQALVTILCDGVQVFERAVGDEPLPLALNVRDVQKLRIVVSSANGLDLFDHATLAGAKVSQ